MQANRRAAAQELFESISDNGTRWVFLIVAEGHWEITRNGEFIAKGTDDPTSIRAGVERFETLTHATPGTKACDPVVLQHLDRIEGKTGRRSVTERKSM